jgi:hypothetical protein
LVVVGMEMVAAALVFFTGEPVLFTFLFHHDFAK